MNDSTKMHIEDFYISQPHLHITLAAKVFAMIEAEEEAHDIFCPVCGWDSDDNRIFCKSHKLPGKLTIRSRFRCQCGEFSGMFDTGYKHILEHMQTVQR